MLIASFGSRERSEASGPVRCSQRLRRVLQHCDSTSDLIANAREFADADGAIVGTSLKSEGVVDRSRVEAVVRAFKNP